MKWTKGGPWTSYQKVLRWYHESLDRLGSSLKRLIEVIMSLTDNKTWFKSLQESIDTGLSGGKPIFQVFGALTEF